MEYILIFYIYKSIKVFNMKLYELIVITFLSIILMQCKSSKQNQSESVFKEKEIKLESQGDITTGKVFFQKWVAGQQDGGSGINIYFPELVNKNNYTIGNVYFRGMIGQIINGKASPFASLRFVNKDIIMSSDANAEYGNDMPKVFPFKLKDNECVISYNTGNEIKYYKIENILEKATQFMPSAPPSENRD